MPVDHFPSTHRTWIAEELARGEDGLASARRHVMARSHAPLVAYVRGAQRQSADEAEEMVHDFFAKRLAQEDYLPRWLASGLPLRRWLMNGVSAHLRASWRARRDATGRAESEFPLDLARGSEDDAVREFERSWVRTTLGEAVRRACDGLSGGGEEEVRRAFERHVLEGLSYRAMLEADGVVADPASEERLAVAVRRVLRLVRGELRRLLLADGISAAEVELEVGRMLEALGE
jgi:hypothetical protein